MKYVTNGNLAVGNPMVRFSIYQFFFEYGILLP